MYEEFLSKVSILGNTEIVNVVDKTNSNGNQLGYDGSLYGLFVCDMNMSDHHRVSG